MSQILLHFGLAKTATTYLQRYVFPTASSVNYVGKPIAEPPGRVVQFLERTFGMYPTRSDYFNYFYDHEDDLRFKDYNDLNHTNLVERWRHLLSRNELNVWSHEGYIRPGRKSSPLDRNKALANIIRACREAGCTDIRALVVLRETRSMMASYAIQFHRDFNYLQIDDCAFSDLQKYIAGDLDNQFLRLMWRLWYQYFDYTALVNDLDFHFGEQNVSIVKYEELENNWNLVEEILQKQDPEVRCQFPKTRENESKNKSYILSPQILSYLDRLKNVDIENLYPENATLVEQRKFTLKR
jgi:hypothetical protein